MMQSIKKRIFLPAIILIAAIAADQIIKFAVKLSMFKHESIRVFDWFYIYFVENKGMAFGMAFGGLWGKVLLSLFRIVLFGALCWWIDKLAKKPTTEVKASPVVNAAPVAPAAIENRSEIVAAVCAAVAEENGTDISAIRVVSFKKL